MLDFACPWLLLSHHNMIIHKIPVFFAPLKCLNMFFFDKKIFEWNIPPLKWAVNTCSDVQSDPSWSDVLSVQCQQSTTDENKFKIPNYWTKQYINRNNQWSFFVVTFGLFFPRTYSWCLSLSQDQETTWFGVYVYLSNFEEKRRLLYSRSAIPKRPRTSIFNILAF